MKNKNATLRQEQLDISKAQAEHVAQPDRVADQLRWKTMATMWVSRLLPTLPRIGLPARPGYCDNALLTA
jgi:hypothetical protein